MTPVSMSAPSQGLKSRMPIANLNFTMGIKRPLPGGLGLNQTSPPTLQTHRRAGERRHRFYCAVMSENS